MVADVGAAKGMLEPDRPHQEGKKLYQYIWATVGGMLAIQCGMIMAWTSPILPYLTSKESFLSVNEDQSSWISSLMALGGFFGAVPAGSIADKFGRKRSILMLSVPFLISWILIIFAQNVTTIYVARLIGGIAAGAFCVIGPIYIGEIAETSVRGALGASFQVTFAIGILYSYAAGSLLDYTAFAVSCALTILPFLAAYPFMPESPVWLIKTGRRVEATKALERLRGPDYDRNLEISVLQKQADEQDGRKGGLKDLVSTRGERKALTTCLGLMLFQQLTGVDAVLFYTVTIFQDAGSTIAPHIATIFIGCIEVTMAVVTALVIDKAGRRPLLVISGGVMAICLGVLGYYFKMKDDGTDISNIGWLPLATLGLYTVIFPIGYGAIPWMMVSELFPPRTKGIASSISVMLNWALVFAVTQLFPRMTNHFGSAITFWIFAALMVVGTIFPLFLVPETKGKSLQRIQDELNGHHTEVLPLQTLDRS